MMYIQLAREVINFEQHECQTVFNDREVNAFAFEVLELLLTVLRLALVKCPVFAYNVTDSDQALEVSTNLDRFPGHDERLFNR